MATLNLIKREGKRGYRRVGRGQGSSRGKQSGRGGKGQTARAGNKRRPELRDIIKKIPKRRGYGKNRGRSVVGTRPDTFAIALGRLETLFENGSQVNFAALAEKGLVVARKIVPIKIVGGGSLTKKLTLTGIDVSTGARAAIEKAGGTVGAAFSRVVKKVKQAKKIPAKK